MKVFAIRHGDFSPVNGGRPTSLALRMFLQLLKKLLIVGLACSGVPRTQELAIRGARRCGAKQLTIIKEFNPLGTTKWPKLFGGWLYELLHRWQLFNHVCLILWWVGLPIFTEGPAQFLERTIAGIEKLRAAVDTADEVFLVCHQETIIALRMIVNKESPIRAFSLRRRVRHLEINEFKI